MRRCRRALSRASSASRPEPRLTNGSPTSVSWLRRRGSKRPTTGSMRLPKRWGYRRRRRCGSTSAGRWTRHLPRIAAGSPPRRVLHRFRNFAVQSRNPRTVAALIRVTGGDCRCRMALDAQKNLASQATDETACPTIAHRHALWVRRFRASRASGRHWSVAVTHRFLRRGEIIDNFVASVAP